MQKVQDTYHYVGQVTNEYYISPNGKRIIVIREGEVEIVDEINFAKSLFELSEAEIRDALDVPQLSLSELEWHRFAAAIFERGQDK